MRPPKRHRNPRPPRNSDRNVTNSNGSRNDQARDGVVALDDDELDVAGANEKGLLVDFTIIGSRIGTVPPQPTTGRLSRRTDESSSG